MTTKKEYKCPACDTVMKPPRVSVSRYRNTYICADCGVKEAIEKFFWAKSPNAKKLPDQSGFEPW